MFGALKSLQELLCVASINWNLTTTLPGIWAENSTTWNRKSAERCETWNKQQEILRLHRTRSSQKNCEIFTATGQGSCKTIVQVCQEKGYLKLDVSPFFCPEFSQLIFSRRDERKKKKNVLLCVHPPVFDSSGSYETHAGLHLVVNSHQSLLSVLQSQSSISQSCLCLPVLLLAELLIGNTQCTVPLLDTDNERTSYLYARCHSVHSVAGYVLFHFYFTQWIIDCTILHVPHQCSTCSDIRSWEIGPCTRRAS